jgi:hypothetical protein
MFVIVVLYSWTDYLLPWQSRTYDDDNAYNEPVRPI